MNCLFCNQRCSQTIVETAGDYLPTITDYFCNGCDANFTYYHEQDALRHYHFFVGEWLAQFWTEEQEFTLSRLGAHTHDDVLSLDFIPNLTPQNFLQKLPTLLTFL